jgi:hypothetical protein
MFSVVMRLKPAIGDRIDYHCQLLVRRGDRVCVCGIVTLHGLGEYVAFLKLLEAIQIPVTHESPVQTEAADAATIG